jgi:hypothetical protein
MEPSGICVIIAVVSAFGIYIHAKLTKRESGLLLGMANFLSCFGLAYSLYFLWLVAVVLKKQDLGALSDKRVYLVLGGLASVGLSYTALERAFKKSSQKGGDKENAG